MDAVIKVINIIGSAGAVVGIVWSLIGAYQFFQGRTVIKTVWTMD